MSRPASVNPPGLLFQNSDLRLLETEADGRSCAALSPVSSAPPAGQNTDTKVSVE